MVKWMLSLVMVILLMPGVDAAPDSERKIPVRVSGRHIRMVPLADCAVLLPPTLSMPVDPGPESEYMMRVRRKIEETWCSHLSKSTVTVKFKIRPDGSAYDIGIVCSARQHSADQASIKVARKTIELCQPFPRVPQNGTAFIEADLIVRAKPVSKDFFADPYLELPFDSQASLEERIRQTGINGIKVEQARQAASKKRKLQR
ncbi:MAG: TonB C-terminal domain-containing protein [Candidatus Obscuribacterales bacterium]|nr:TonB C-terminal domain-containing protein [Candidatus Obscuribacterales bacterium]